MDFLGFVFTPQGFVSFLALGVASGATIGLLMVLLTLFYGRGGS